MSPQQDPASKPHVVICTDGVFPQAMGGMQRHSRLLAEHLAATGRIRLTVIHPHEAGVFAGVDGIEEVPISGIDTSSFYLAELWRYSGRVASELERLRPDVILSQGFSVWKHIDRFSDRLIVHPHGLEMFQGLTRKERIMGLPFRWAVRYMARRSAVVISLGGKLTTILSGLVEGSKARVVVIPNAVDVPPLPQETSRSGPMRALFVGRFAWNKGIDLLITVARRLEKELPADKIRIQLAGDGPLLATIKAAGVPSNVELLGRVDDERLFELYTDCDVFVLPTRFEGMPTVVLEAMARACPIIVSDVGATAELVDGTNGSLLPSGDPEALYLALKRMLDASPGERQAMGMASYQRCAARFDWHKVADHFVDLFTSMARR
ncbi:MAG: glycosyltransferase family 4 protein [Flavobacteriales bacterium]|nr:glycosyltransferase family 4 protein [Flavobacteriales bacterium]